MYSRLGYIALSEGADDKVYTSSEVFETEEQANEYLQNMVVNPIRVIKIQW